MADAIGLDGLGNGEDGNGQLHLEEQWEETGRCT